MIYRIEKDDFRLDLELSKLHDHEPGDKYMNAVINIRVASDGFSGHTSLDFDTEDFRIFQEGLQKLKETLTGKVELKEPYTEDPLVELEGDGRGHIHVSGTITSIGGDWTQELHFENEIDQTCLPMKHVDEEEL